MVLAGGRDGGQRRGPTIRAKRREQEAAQPVPLCPSAAWGEMPCTHNTAPRNVSGAWSGLRGHRPRSLSAVMCTRSYHLPLPSLRPRIRIDQFFFYLPPSPLLSFPSPPFELCSGDWQLAQNSQITNQPATAPPGVVWVVTAQRMVVERCVVEMVLERSDVRTEVIVGGLQEIALCGKGVTADIWQAYSQFREDGSIDGLTEALAEIERRAERYESARERKAAMASSLAQTLAPAQASSLPREDVPSARVNPVHPMPRTLYSPHQVPHSPTQDVLGFGRDVLEVVGGGRGGRAHRHADSEPSPDPDASRPMSTPGPPAPAWAYHTGHEMSEPCEPRPSYISFTSPNRGGSSPPLRPLRPSLQRRCLGLESHADGTSVPTNVGAPTHVIQALADISAPRDSVARGVRDQQASTAMRMRASLQPCEGAARAGWHEQAHSSLLISPIVADRGAGLPSRVFLQSAAAPSQGSAQMHALTHVSTIARVNAELSEAPPPITFRPEDGGAPGSTPKRNADYHVLSTVSQAPSHWGATRQLPSPPAEVNHRLSHGARIHAATATEVQQHGSSAARHRSGVPHMAPSNANAEDRRRTRDVIAEHVDLSLNSVGLVRIPLSVCSRTHTNKHTYHRVS